MRSSSGDLEETVLFFSRQAAWTAPLRRHLYRKAGLARKAAVLDVGCGTGEVTAEMAGLAGGEVTGVDVNRDFLAYASSRYPDLEFVEADCAALPFDDGTFDLVTCHFLLMWLKDPGRAVSEMARVLQPGGILLACAEPDYGGRVEFPEHPEFAGSVEEALGRKGADPRAGRKVGALFRRAGLGVQVGVSATVWEDELLLGEFEAGMSVYLSDLTLVLGAGEAGRVLDEELSQVRAGKMLMVPVFWALGFKHEE